MLSLENLREISNKYQTSRDGQRLAHTFPGNNKTCKAEPRKQYLESGGGLAVPYQNQQKEWINKNSGGKEPKEPLIWLTPLPATFYNTFGKEH